MIRLSASVTLMFHEHAPEGRFDALAAAGFDGAEIQVLEGDPAILARRAREAGVAIALLNVGMGDFLTGGPGLSGVPGREKEFAEALAITMDAADALRPDRIHIGPSRVPNGVDRSACLAVFEANLAAACAAAAPLQARVLVEPLNRDEAPDALFADLASASAFLRASDGRAGLQFDAYHAALNGEDPADAFTAHQDLVDHVQFSDAPGRGAPGSGSVDFDRFFASLPRSGYSGWMGAEYFSAAPTEASLGWLEAARKAVQGVD